jgi:hypothetical protein
MEVLPLIESHKVIDRDLPLASASNKVPLNRQGRLLPLD